MATFSGTKMLSTLLLITFAFPFTQCWDNDDLELFDLVEEVDKNFYELFNIDQSASTSEVRRAYRRLSLQYHPDKNAADEAEEQFRQVVAVYEVLKDEKKRERYNQVLIEGLPDWRQPVYYYRRARKMGLFELAILLSIICTIGQYLVGWAVYIEKRLVMEEALSSKRKKRSKKSKVVVDDDEEEDGDLNSIPMPSVFGLWPIRLTVGLFRTVYNLPETIKEWKLELEHQKQEKERLRIQALQDAIAQQKEAEEFTRKPKKRVQPVLPEYSDALYSKFAAPGDKKNAVGTLAEELERVNNLQENLGDWTEEDFVLLAKAVNKFPGGTHQRWEKIAEMVGRSVAEVTSKSKETRSGSYSMKLSTAVQGLNANSNSASIISDDIITQNTVPEQEEDTDSQMRKRLKAKAGKTDVDSEDVKDNLKNRTSEAQSKVKVSSGENWTQNQQTIFEWALKQYPKGTDKRWDRVAEHIPGKSKEACIARFKVLAELISKKKKMEQCSKTS